MTRTYESLKSYEDSTSLFLSDSTPHIKLRGDDRSNEEPMTHQLNGTFLESCLGNCLGQYSRTKLTLSERESFHILKEDVIKFDHHANEYDELFSELWTALTSEPFQGEIINKGWKQFGFQNSNPKSDFGGAGLIALKQLLRFAKNNKLKVKRMIMEEYDFLFALCSIHISYFLIRYFHLADGLDVKCDKKHLATRIGLKCFCQCLINDKELLNKIHDMLLKDLFEVWLSYRKKVKGVTLLDFDIAESLIKEKFRTITDISYYKSFEELQNRYSKITEKIPEKRPSLVNRPQPTVQCIQSPYL